MILMTERGFDEWIRALRDAARDVPEHGERVAGRGSLNIKNGARRRVEGNPHLPHYPRSISYDVHRRGTLVTAETGPDKQKRQGALGNLIEYGSVNNAPIPHLSPELDLEEPRFVNAVGDLGEELLERLR